MAGTTAVQKALFCVYRTGQRFGAGHLIDVLVGKDGERIQSQSGGAGLRGTRWGGARAPEGLTSSPSGSHGGGGRWTGAREVTGGDVDHAGRAGAQSMRAAASPWCIIVLAS